MCCYSGGFGLAASRLGQAAEVIGVDTSEAAIELGAATQLETGSPTSGSRPATVSAHWKAWRPPGSGSRVWCSTRRNSPAADLRSPTPCELTTG